MRGIEIKVCLLSYEKAVELRLREHKDPYSTRVNFRLITEKRLPCYYQCTLCV